MFRKKSPAHEAQIVAASRARTQNSVGRATGHGDEDRGAVQARRRISSSVVEGRRTGCDLPQVIEQWAATNAMKAVPIFLWHSMVKGARDKREALQAEVGLIAKKGAAV